MLRNKKNGQIIELTFVGEAKEEVGTSSIPSAPSLPDFVEVSYALPPLGLNSLAALLLSSGLGRGLVPISLSAELPFLDILPLENMTVFDVKK